MKKIILLLLIIIVVSCQSNNDKTIEAINAFDYDKLIEIEKTGFDISKTDYVNIAIMSLNIEMIEYYLDKVPKLELYQETLDILTQNKELDILTLLINKGFTSSSKSKTEQFMMKWAIKNNNTSIIVDLLRNGFNSKSKIDNTNFVDFIFDNLSRANIYNLMLQYDTQQLVNNDMLNLTSKLFIDNDFGTINNLLNNNIQFNNIGPNGKNSWYFIVSNIDLTNTEEILALFESLKNEIDFPTNNSNIYHYLYSENQIDLLKWLLKNGCSSKLKNSNGQTIKDIILSDYENVIPDELNEVIEIYDSLLFLNDLDDKFFVAKDFTDDLKNTFIIFRFNRDKSVFVETHQENSKTFTNRMIHNSGYIDTTKYHYIIRNNTIIINDDSYDANHKFVLKNNEWIFEYNRYNVTDKSSISFIEMDDLYEISNYPKSIIEFTNKKWKVKDISDYGTPTNSEKRNTYFTFDLKNRSAAYTYFRDGEYITVEDEFIVISHNTIYLMNPEHISFFKYFEFKSGSWEYVTVSSLVYDTPVSILEIPRN